MWTLENFWKTDPLLGMLLVKNGVHVNLSRDFLQKYQIILVEHLVMSLSFFFFFCLYSIPDYTDLWDTGYYKQNKLNSWFLVKFLSFTSVVQVVQCPFKLYKATKTEVFQTWTFRIVLQFKILRLCTDFCTQTNFQAYEDNFKIWILNDSKKKNRVQKLYGQYMYVCT